MNHFHGADYKDKYLNKHDAYLEDLMAPGRPVSVAIHELAATGLGTAARVAALSGDQLAAAAPGSEPHGANPGTMVFAPGSGHGGVTTPVQEPAPPQRAPQPKE
jgi:hypothetical protein